MSNLSGKLAWSYLINNIELRASQGLLRGLKHFPEINSILCLLTISCWKMVDNLVNILLWQYIWVSELHYSSCVWTWASNIELRASQGLLSYLFRRQLHELGICFRSWKGMVDWFSYLISSYYIWVSESSSCIIRLAFELGHQRQWEFRLWRKGQIFLYRFCHSGLFNFIPSSR